MKNRMKRFLALMLASSMVVGAAPITAGAEENTASQEQSVTAEPAAEDTTDEAAASAEVMDEAANAAAAASQAADAANGTDEAQPADAAQARSAVQARGIDWEAVKDAIWKGIFEKRDNTVIDLSEYKLAESEAVMLTDEVLEESNTTEFVETEIQTDAQGEAATMSVSLDPEIKAFAEELDDMTVMAEDGTTNVPLTEEQKKELTETYAQYLAFLSSENMINFFGVRAPFFTTKDTDISPLGSMLIMMGNTQEQVDNGEVPYDTLKGTIDLFQLGNGILVQLYGEQLLAAKDEALAQLNDGMTDIEKLLALNDWLAEKCNFDMAYIMSKTETPMTAPEPTDDEYAVAIKAALTQTFKDKGIPEEMVPAYVEQMAPGVIGLYKGNHFGALVMHKAVCLGYSNAYTYLLQWAFPEVYKNADGTWKTEKELNSVATEVPAVDDNGDQVVDANGNKVTTTEYIWDADAGYIADYVRIQFNASVTMYGEKQENFSSEHYWNAVKVNGKWYYIDPCYTDIYIECMLRDRVETDGNMNHMYFMFSDTTARQLYDGYYSDLGTLYEGIATDQTYEDAWFAFAKSPVKQTDGKSYYFYDSTDLISMLGQYGDMGGNKSKASNTGFEQDTEYKLVYHDNSMGDADASYTELINFTDGTVLNPATGEMVANDTIKTLYAEQEAYADKYPSVAISGDVYNNVFYFNISNCIMAYDLSTGAVTKVKEYNKVSAVRDMTNEFGGMAFTVAADGTEGALTVNNNPIASMTIKEDGKMYVSIATNYAYISGKSSITDTSSNGYEFEETDYNPDYSTYMNDSGYGEKEINDNDEFMWSANFVETLDMAHVAGADHTYEAVTVAPSCEKDGYTEERCTVCGISKAVNQEEPGDGSEGDSGEGTEGSGDSTEGGAEAQAETENKATGHQYVKFNQTYYTKDDSGEWNTGTAYVCTVCKDSKESLDSGEEALGHTYGDVVFTWSDDYSKCTASKSCTTCSTVKLDCTVTNPEIVKKAECEVTKNIDEFDCEKGGTIIYTATATLDGEEVKDPQTVTVQAGTHTYADPTIKWADDHSTCKFTAKCTNCGKEDSVTVDSTVKENVDSTCAEEGKIVYAATGTLGSQSFDATEEVKVEKKDHKYGEPKFNWSDDKKSCEAVFICEKCNDTQTVKCEVTSKKDGNSTIYTATCTFNDEKYTEKQTVKNPSKTMPFTDVKKGDWFYDVVQYVYDNGIMTGLNKTTFGSAENLSRAHFVCILYRMEGSPKVTFKNKFSDVKDGEFYSEAVTWASSEGVISGYEDGRFGPADNITREQIAVMMNCYAKYKGEDVSQSANLNKYPDGKSVSSFATESVKWAVAEGLIKGQGDGTLDPQGDTSRAACAAIITRYLGGE